MATMKKGFAQRNFKDAGTEQSWAAGDPVEVEAGAYDNYEAAKLVGPKKPTAEKASDAPATTA